MIRALIFDYYGVLRPELGNRPLNSLGQDRELLAYIAGLRPVYKTGLLTNAGADAVSRFFPDGTAEHYFDTALASGETSYAKPDREIFVLIAERLGLLPKDCLMIDDTIGHCIGARQAGMQALQYHDFTRFQTEVRSLLTT